MTGSELIRHLIDDSAYQVGKVFEGIPEDVADMKVNEHCMSARETLTHLCDCVQALFAAMDDTKYAWGSFQPADSSIEGLLKAFREMRATVRERVTAQGEDDKTLKLAADYVVGHEFYHVGQMASFRLTFTPGWDAYSIYPSA